MNYTFTTPVPVAPPYPLKAPDGTLAAPSYSFTNGTDTGMWYDSAAKVLHLVANSAFTGRDWLIDNRGNFYAGSTNSQITAGGFTSTSSTNSFGGTASNFNPSGGTTFSTGVNLNGVTSVGNAFGIGSAGGGSVPTSYIGDGVLAKFSYGTGVPTFTSGKGSIFMRTDGGAGTTMYINETGSNVWRAV